MARIRTKPVSRKANRDPLTDESGAHPVGVGVGAASGATAGAAVGVLGGPVAAGVGAVVGGVVGGLAGKAVAEDVNPSDQDAYWRENYSSRPYVSRGAPYEKYQPAYRFGWEARGRYGELNWEGAESRLRQEWLEAQGTAGQAWGEARDAARDAWNRIRPDADYSRENR